MFSLNTWDVAVALTNFDWTIFNSIQEVCPTPCTVLSCKVYARQIVPPAGHKCSTAETRPPLFTVSLLLFFSNNWSTSPLAAMLAATTLWR